jgi:hypothetical protein
MRSKLRKNQQATRHSKMLHGLAHDAGNPSIFTKRMTNSDIARDNPVSHFA